MAISSSRSFSELNDVYKTSVNSLMSEEIQRRYKQLTEAEKLLSQALHDNWSESMQTKFAELLRDHTIGKMRTIAFQQEKILELTINQLKIIQQLPEEQCKKELNRLCQYLETVKSIK